MVFSIEIEQEEDGRWIAEVLELSGVMAYGPTPEEAKAKVQALALRVVEERLLEDGAVAHRSKDILGGTPVFKGTRVPLKNLIDYLEGGDSLDEFLDDFPTVTREQALHVIEFVKRGML